MLSFKKNTINKIKEIFLSEYQNFYTFDENKYKYILNKYVI